MTIYEQAEADIFRMIGIARASGRPVVIRDYLRDAFPPITASDSVNDLVKEIYMDVCERVEKDGYIAKGFIETYNITIQAYVDAQSNKWISVKKKLPDEGDVVLIYFNPYFASASYSRSSNGFFLPDGMFVSATHWQPLPEAPK